MYCVNITAGVNCFPGVIAEGLVGFEDFLLKGNILVSLPAKLGSLECLRKWKVQEAYKIWSKQTLVWLLAPVKGDTLRRLVSTNVSF